LHESLAMHNRLVEAASLVSGLDPSQPDARARALAPAAEVLGFAPDDPAAWPASFFITMHGHLERARTPA
jgi:hypothetical protein